MKTVLALTAGLAVTAALAASPAAAATPFSFTTGAPDGKLGALSRPADRSHVQTETADDFILGSETRLTTATFTGLLAPGAKVTDIKDVEIEFYHLFPGDSANRTPGVTTRVNSPGDREIEAATRDAADGSLSFSAAVVNPTFTAANSVVDGIHGGDATTEFTGGEGPVTGQEVTFTVTFDKSVLLDPAHLFFRPEVEMGDGSNFLWLSAPKAAPVPGTPSATDLQAWIRNDNLAPDWVRIGTDVTHQAPVNMSFSLGGVAGVPEPAAWALMLAGFGMTGSVVRRNRRAPRATAA